VTGQQTANIVAMVRVLWPHSPLGDDPAVVLRLWRAMLGQLDAVEVEAALKEYAAAGERHAPAPGVILNMVAKRQTDLPEWDEVRDELLHAARTYRRPPDIEGTRIWKTDPAAEPPPVGYWSHPIVAEFMDGRWPEWRAQRAGTDTTFMAQQRDAYNALRARVERDTGLVMIGAPRRRGELARSNMAALLPTGTEG
jgi:hypothetical protein